MVHTYKLMGYNIALDVCSGAVHILDDISYDILSALGDSMPDVCPDRLYALPYPKSEIDEAYAELSELKSSGQLFSEDDFEPYAAMYDEDPPVKALCLHVSHDCNLRCKYCFAGTGNFGGKRITMTPETAIAAMDFVVKMSKNRKNIEVDFFGGEPLIAFDTVVKTVEYVRAREKEWGKAFRFTMTTNGVALDEKKLEFINREMSNLVLSLDGRKEVNDRFRVDAGGNGSYDRVMPRLLAAAKSREGRDHYVRGTFTRQNLDFVNDVLHLADLGFHEISVEPVVTPDPGMKLTAADLPAIYAEYERLCKIMTERSDFRFFHFNVDLKQGPCVIKRMRGCGAGSEYLAVTPDGELFPCHQFVGKDEFKVGSIYDPDHLDRGIMRRFLTQNVYTRPACKTCFAKFYCSGGCSAANYNENGDLSKAYELGCDIERKRIECAVMLAAAREMNEK